jgi:hypothetical protein
MNMPRTVQFLCGSTLLAVTVACSPPTTDILATVSEDVGAWDVLNAQAQGPTLTADVCMDRAGSADDVSERLLMQLRAKGFQQIDLTMYGRDGKETQVRKVRWTPTSGKQMQQGSATGDSPCAAPQQGQQSQEQGRSKDATH